jgi:hypothetical protein
MPDPKNECDELPGILLIGGSSQVLIPGLPSSQREACSANSRGWKVSAESALEPIRLAPVIKVRAPRVLEMRRLARRLNLKRIDFDAPLHLPSTITEFVEDILNEDVSASIAEIDRHLKKTINAANLFLATFRPVLSVPRDQQYVPAPQLVLGHFLANRDKRAFALASLSSTRTVIELCEELRQQIGKVARGRKPESSFQYLMDSVVCSAGEHRTLPSNGQKGGLEGIKAAASTPLLKFARATLELALVIAEEAIAKHAGLSKKQKVPLASHAHAACGKTDGAVIDALRKSLKNKHLYEEEIEVEEDLN